ncbi:MAG: cytochrome C [Thiotrichales bacterium SG8_50]|nr:MAG: cytochrome C [Thiotrichales bacterium SG8_50]
MNKSIVLGLLLLMPGLATASGGGVHLEQAHVNVQNQASLQNGAKLFVNYCLSCHSARFMRYSRLARDLGLTEEQVKENLMFIGEKLGDTMTVNMPTEDSKRWFGTPPPDLSVIARSRGPDWLYTYMKTFYVDASRPFGANNAVFPDVGMPHVMWELEGLKRPVFETHVDADGKEVKSIVGYEMVQPGKLSPLDYDAAVADLVNFLVYLGEPGQFDRKRIGLAVLLFLGLLAVLSYYLKKEYWKDVH